MESKKRRRKNLLYFPLGTVGRDMVYSMINYLLMRPFITKMSSALIVALMFASYLLFGVTGYTNQISDLEQQCAQGLITEE